MSRRQVTTAGDIHPRKEPKRIKRIARWVFQTKLRGVSTILAIGLMWAGLSHLSHLKTDMIQYLEHPYAHRDGGH